MPTPDEEQLSKMRNDYYKDFYSSRGLFDKRRPRPFVNTDNKAKPIKMYDTKGNLLKTYSSVYQAVLGSGISRYDIYRCLNNEIPCVKGYIWRR